MKSVLQFMTIAVLALELTGAVMFLSIRIGNPEAIFLGKMLVAMVAAAVFLFVSYRTEASWPAIAALVIAALPLIPILPVLV